MPCAAAGRGAVDYVVAEVPGARRGACGQPWAVGNTQYIWSVLDLI